MDHFIEKIFKNKIFDQEKLLQFGFEVHDDQLTYSTAIAQGQFRLEICIQNAQEIQTKLIDCTTNEEYCLHLVEGVAGKFIGEIRDEYTRILHTIANECCKSTYFSSLQANTLTEWIEQKYGSTPEFLWKKFPGYAIFRNKNTEKWYGLIADIDYQKLDNTQKDTIEILNIKISKEKIQNLLTFKGFYPAYHMNKAHWITIVLDGTVTDAVIKELLDESYTFSQKK